VKGLEPVTDMSVGAWIAPRLGPFGGWVSSVVPREFEAYARVLHPVDLAGRVPPDDLTAVTTWAAVCRATGRTPHALMQWLSVSRPGGDRAWLGGEPRQGELQPEALGRLLRVLGRFTDPARPCFHALWEGYGWVNGQGVSRLAWDENGVRADPPPVVPAVSAEVRAGPRLRHPHRGYLLFRGDLSAALDMGYRPFPDWFVPQSPNILWPEDRLWCVATEIDFDSTLVGGSAALVGAILADPDLETWPVDPDDNLSHNGDAINE
jgi:hypothetical protein